MKKDELKGKTADQLGEMVTQLKKEQLNLRFQRAAGESANSSRFRAIRRTIARAKTLMNELKKKSA